MNLSVVLGVIIIAAVLAGVLKQYRLEYSLFVVLIAGVLVVIFISEKVITGLYSLLNTALDFGLNGGYFSLALKTLGICVLTGFIADTCRDSGNFSLASKAELAGRCAVFILSIPLLTSLLESAKQIIG